MWQRKNNETSLGIMPKVQTEIPTQRRAVIKILQDRQKEFQLLQRKMKKRLKDKKYQSNSKSADKRPR